MKRSRGQGAGGRGREGWHIGDLGFEEEEGEERGKGRGKGRKREGIGEGKGKRREGGHIVNVNVIKKCLFGPSKYTS